VTSAPKGWQHSLTSEASIAYRLTEEQQMPQMSRLTQPLKPRSDVPRRWMCAGSGSELRGETEL
jgi:hypothetical protein